MMEKESASWRGTTILSVRKGNDVVIAGDGPARLQLDSILGRCAHHKRVHLPGAIGRQQVAQLLAESDLFVNPGIIDSNGRAEGLGITTIEAMASGLSVVGSRVGGIVETIFDNVTGLLIPPGDVGALAGAVGRLLDDPDLRRRMGAAGRDIARKQFAWPALAAKVAAIYSKIHPRR